MAMSDVVSFLRTGGHTLDRPEILGLPATSGHSDWTLEQARERFTSALVAGDEEACRRIIIDLYLAQHSLAVICDEVVAAAFRTVGEQWECGHVEVYEERRGCEICVRVVHELRSLLEPPAPQSPVAIGATLDGDPYTLAVAMAELALREAGYYATSLGHMLPFRTLHAAVQRYRPRMLFISVSAIRDPEQFAVEFNALSDAAAEIGTAIAIGGRALTPEIRRQIRYGAYCDTYVHLESFARTLLAAPEEGAERPGEPRRD